MIKKPLRSFWTDWQAEDAVPPTSYLTRDELLRAVALYGGRGVISEPALRAWESKGVLPQPVRQKHGDTVRALYPQWAVNLVWRVQVLQQDNHLTLPEIIPYTRADAWRLSRLRGPQSLAVHDPFTPLQITTEQLAALDRAMRLLLAHHVEEGFRPIRARLVFEDNNGRDLTYAFQIGQGERPSETPEGPARST